MTIVVDASVVVAALVDTGPDGLWAEDLIAHEDLVAPHLLLVEAANVLRRAELAGDLDRTVVSLAHGDLLRLPVELLPYAPFGARIWELRGNLSTYDAWYVAIAETLEVPLATLDRRLAGAPVRCHVLLPTAGPPPSAAP
ncbi:MAG TPA: type II toxin-antitoxin system VapC family toxin [Candidatus Binatia bacterium]|nr:type II toxin-antitoxin system VapC family toxin [Candidatus Binatia bacterium]